jgi:hypothetical protein
MTLELVDLDRLPGYAGTLHAGHPALVDRFHFWRGISFRRYACTRFPAGRVPDYAGSVALFVRRSSRTLEVLGISAVPGCPVIPVGTNEVHLHIVHGGADAVEAAFQDLIAAAGRHAPHAPAASRAA